MHNIKETPGSLYETNLFHRVLQLLFFIAFFYFIFETEKTHLCADFACYEFHFQLGVFLYIVGVNG
jgi:cytochrome b561